MYRISTYPFSISILRDVQWQGEIAFSRHQVGGQAYKLEAMTFLKAGAEVPSGADTGSRYPGDAIYGSRRAAPAPPPSPVVTGSAFVMGSVPLARVERSQIRAAITGIVGASVGNMQASPLSLLLTFFLFSLLWTLHVILFTVGYCRSTL
jgi:hypothetical protein